MKRAMDAVRGGTLPKVAARDNGVRLGYLYQRLKAANVPLPVRTRAAPPPRPTRLRAGDRVVLSDGRRATICARVLPRDAVAFALPDDHSRVVTVDALIDDATPDEGGA